MSCKVGSAVVVLLIRIDSTILILAVSKKKT